MLRLSGMKGRGWRVVAVEKNAPWFETVTSYEDDGSLVGLPSGVVIFPHHYPQLHRRNIPQDRTADNPYVVGHGGCIPSMADIKTIESDHYHESTPNHGFSNNNTSPTGLLRARSGGWPVNLDCDGGRFRPAKWFKPCCTTLASNGGNRFEVNILKGPSLTIHPMTLTCETPPPPGIPSNGGK